jgi:hypothetical protein
MDGRVSETLFFTTEVAVKTWVCLTIILLVMTAPFAESAKPDDSGIAHVVFFVG